MDSAHTGEVVVGLGGGRVLRYDWAALSRLRTELGKDYEQEIARAMAELDTTVIARALACGLLPAMTVAEIERESPPLVATAAAIERALKYAYYGGEVPASVPTDPSSGLSRLIRSLTHIGSRLGQALGRGTSGGSRPGN